MAIPWNTLSNIAGVLGFFGSIGVFIITRIEIRKRLTLSLSTGPMPAEAGFPRGSLDPAFIIQMTNSSSRPITVDISSLKISTLRNASLKGIEWVVVGTGDGTYRKMNQADSIRFICKLVDLLSEAERLGFKEGVIPLTITLNDTEGKMYRKIAKYNQETLSISGQNTNVLDAEIKYINVDINYPKTSGLQRKMETDGYRIAWSSEDRLSAKIMDEWEEVVLTDRGKRYKLKLKDRPTDQVLIRKLNT